jgi:hypothetical protein
MEPASGLPDPKAAPFKLSGADLARVALRAARESARRAAQRPESARRRLRPRQARKPAVMLGEVVHDLTDLHFRGR